MDSKIIDIMIQAVGQTVYMVFFSTLFASILGFILGIVVTVTSPKGLKPNKIIYNVLDLIINVLNEKKTLLSKKCEIEVIEKREIKNFIEDNMKDVTIDMLVERFGYQEDYFNRFLKAQTGMTFTEYLQDCRLNKSAILLKDDSMDVDEIIKKVGYRNKGYFYRIFTEKYNMTPAKFRKYIKEKELTI